MKIAFYIHHSTISAGGIFTYSIGILRQLVNSPDIEKIIIITSKEVADTLAEFRKNKKIEISIVDRKNILVNLMFLNWYGLYIVTLFVQKLVLAKVSFNRVKQFLAKLNPYQIIFKINEIDILHIPVQYSPIYKANTPVIITMHDLQEYHFPQYFSLKERLHRFINNRMAIYDSDHIIVSFEHIKKDIIKYFNIDSEKVSVCPPPFAEDWFLNKNESDWNQIQKKYNLKKKYILYPAATWEHKNHLTLLDAVKKIRNEGLDYELLCTGNKTKYFSILVIKIKELQLSDSVHFLGIVPEEDLISLYKNSALVVIPTLYEAGSGPLYEAMRYQVPVICSKVTSLPDTVANNEFLFDPENVSELVMKIKSGLIDEDFRRRNIENSKQRMEYFRKKNYSENFIEVYKRLYKQVDLH